MDNQVPASSLPKLARSKVPFNIEILDLSPAKLQGLRPVTALDIFDGAGANFHDDGLFSTVIFGRVGDERRNMRFSYIDIKVKILHPVVYRSIVALRRAYAGILAGTEYVIWNDEVKDFEKSNQIEGKTGFQYFLEHWEKIKFRDSSSVSREQNISLLKKYMSRAMTDKIVVMPAGLRDLEVDQNGRMKEDEINSLYRKLLSLSNTISEAAVKKNPELINTTRYSLQMTFNQLYEMIERMLEGKKKLVQNKWGSRRIMNGTRNVITALDTSSSYLGSDGAVGFNNTVLGLYQMMKAVLPVSKYHLRNGFLASVFTAVDAPARLVNKKTLKEDPVHLKSQYFDRWATDEGIEKVISSFFDINLRHKPIEIDGRYLGLIYKGKDGTFKLLHSVDQVPEGRSKDDVHPLTFAELLYCSLYRHLNKYPVFVTRYPVAGVGSIYPSKAYVKTTMKYEVRKELGDDWAELGKDYTAYEFPVKGSAFMDSLAPHTARLAGLVADFDGDTSSANATYTDEAVKEVDDFLASRKAYIGADGSFLASTDVVTVSLALHNMTGD